LMLRLEVSFDITMLILCFVDAGQAALPGGKADTLLVSMNQDDV
jgi:hypothetical protein